MIPEKVKEVKKLIEKEYLGKFGVVGVGISKEDGEYVVVIYATEVTKELAEFPKRIEGVKVVVKSVSKPKFLSFPHSLIYFIGTYILPNYEIFNIILKLQDILLEEIEVPRFEILKVFKFKREGRTYEFSSDFELRKFSSISIPTIFIKPEEVPFKTKIEVLYDVIFKANEKYRNNIEYLLNNIYKTHITTFFTINDFHTFLSHSRPNVSLTICDNVYCKEKLDLVSLTCYTFELRKDRIFLNMFTDPLKREIRCNINVYDQVADFRIIRDKLHAKVTYDFKTKKCESKYRKYATLCYSPCTVDLIHSFLDYNGEYCYNILSNLTILFSYYIMIINEFLTLALKNPDLSMILTRIFTGK